MYKKRVKNVLLDSDDVECYDKLKIQVGVSFVRCSIYCHKNNNDVVLC